MKMNIWRILFTQYHAHVLSRMVKASFKIQYSTLCLLLSSFQEIKDITFIVEGQKIRAHKTILMIR